MRESKIDRLIKWGLEVNVLENREREREEKTETLGLEGVKPESFVSNVVKALEMAFPSILGVLEFLVAVIAVVLPQRHFSLSLSLSLRLHRMYCKSFCCWILETTTV